MPSWGAYSPRLSWCSEGFSNSKSTLVKITNYSKASCSRTQVMTGIWTHTQMTSGPTGPDYENDKNARPRLVELLFAELSHAYSTNRGRAFLLFSFSFLSSGPVWRALKPLDTFGKQYCPRSTLRVSQLIYKITNLWKLRLNWSSELGENNGKTHPCFRTFCRVKTCV